MSGQVRTVFNRSEIMNAAWAHYRSTLRSWIKEPFDRAKFGWCLQCAWQKAKEAALPPKQQLAARIARQIEIMKFKDGPHRLLGKQRRALEDRLAELVA